MKKGKKREKEVHKVKHCAHALLAHISSQSVAGINKNNVD